GAAETFPNTSDVTVAVGATLDLNSFNDTIGALAGGGNVTLGSAMLTLGATNAGGTFQGAISGSGGLTKLGDGTVVLAGANTYGGATAINAGTLRLGAANAIPNASRVTLGPTALLDLNNFNETVGALAGGGSVTLGSATLTTGGINASTTYGGVITGAG